MKIFVIVGRYPPVFGGATPTLITLFSEMVRRGHEVEFITPKYSTDHPAKEFHNGINVTRISPGITNSWSGIKFTINSINYIIKNKISADVIIDTMPYGLSMPFFQIYAKLKRIPLVARLTQVGTNEPEAALKGKSGKLLRNFVENYDYTICISSALEKICQNANLNPSKFGKIHNAVDTEKFSPCKSIKMKDQLKNQLLSNANRPIILVPGSISPRKRSHLALDAWAILKKKFLIHGTLVFVGPLSSTGQNFDYKYVNMIMDRTKKYELQDSVIFTDYKKNIDEFYKISDLLLFVSSREGLPNVILEGMSCGLPVVSTRIINITDDIFSDGVEGFYTSDNPSEIADRILCILNNQQLKKSMSDASLITINKKFSLKIIADETEKLLNRLVNKNQI